MRLPPFVVGFGWAHPGKRGWNFWIPVFILWPLIAAIALLAVCLALLAAAITFRGRDIAGVLRFSRGLYATVCDLRGAQVDVSGRGHGFHINVI